MATFRVKQIANVTISVKVEAENAEQAKTIVESMDYESLEKNTFSIYSTDEIIVDDDVACICGEADAFEFNGITISDPFMDETGRFQVDPVTYYKEAYADFMIKKHTAIFNEKLKPLGMRVELFTTDESYGEEDDLMDESNPYFMLPMFEGLIVGADGEELEDAYTGRYCDVKSVIEELGVFVDKTLEETSGEVSKLEAIKAFLPELLLTRWTKEELELHLQEKFRLTSVLEEMHESRLLDDYVLTMQIHEDKSIEISYLISPFVVNDICITGIKVSGE